MVKNERNKEESKISANNVFHLHQEARQICYLWMPRPDETQENFKGV